MRGLREVLLPPTGGKYEAGERACPWLSKQPGERALAEPTPGNDRLFSELGIGIDMRGECDEEW